MMKDKQDITSFEEKIMLLMKGGLINKEIATVLGKSTDIIKYHLKKIYKKLGATNRVEAINKFNETYMIDPNYKHK
jgi:LuxR family maltose regulon positive regulatory protein